MTRPRKIRLTIEPRPERPLVMGIVNASPESFSDGAGVGSLEDQVGRARQLVADGADLIDVGGESGVTDRPPISADEEASRVVPLVERLVAEDIVVSVDTWKPAVGRAAVAAGAALVNDVSGLRDPELADVCAESGAGLVIMHTRAEPKVKDFPGYDDLLGDVLGFLRERIALARERGVAEEQIVVDPGPDFAKTPAETVEVLRELPALHALGRPILLAISRKDFVGAITGRPPHDRLGGTLAALAAGADAHAAIVRVHDVAAAVDFLEVRAVLRGEEEIEKGARLAQELRRSG
ncbi:MAG: dihydropteroate synthase [Thermoleophilaceae bacterium]